MFFVKTLAALSYILMSSNSYQYSGIIEYTGITQDTCSARCDALNYCGGYMVGNNICRLLFRMSNDNQLPAIVGESYYRNIRSDNLTTALVVPGWIMDENVITGGWDVIGTLYDGHNSTSDIYTALAICQSYPDTILFSFNNFYKVMVYPDSTAYFAGQFSFTRSSTMHHFSALNYNIYTKPMTPLSQFYTLSACMMECYSTSSCKFIVYKQQPRTCAFLGGFDVSAASKSNLVTGMLIFQKQFEVGSNYSALPNYVFNTTQKSIVSAVSSVACFTNYPAAIAVEYNYATNTCSVINSVNISQLTSTNQDIQTILSHSSLGYRIVPFAFRNDDYYSLVSPSYNNTALLLSCTQQSFCQHVIRYGNGASFHAVQSESSAARMFPNTLNFIKLNKSLQIPGYIVQPYLIVSTSNFTISPLFDETKITAGLILQSNAFKYFSELSPFTFSSTINCTTVFLDSYLAKFTEIQGSSIVNATLINPSVLLKDCLVIATNTYFIFIGYDYKNQKCYGTNTTQNAAIGNYLLDNADIGIFTKVSFPNYSITANKQSTAPYVASTAANLQNCVEICNADSFCLSAGFQAVGSRCFIYCTVGNLIDNPKIVFIQKQFLYANSVGISTTTKKTTVQNSKTILNGFTTRISVTTSSAVLSPDSIETATLDIVNSFLSSEGIETEKLSTTSTMYSDRPINQKVAPVSIATVFVYLIVSIFGVLIAVLVCEKLCQNPDRMRRARQKVSQQHSGN